MLQINIKPKEFWDEEKNMFVSNNIEQVLQLEHSLVSISKWESKWNKPFLGKDNVKTMKENIDYIKCMTITQNVKNEAYDNLTIEDINKVDKYIALPMTATTFNEININPSREIITSELIYYWMISLNIPMECQKWHVNRLLTLIRVCNLKNKPAKKMSKREILESNKSLNDARRKQLNSRG